MTEPRKPTDAYSLYDRIWKLNDCVNALVILRNRSEFHGLDNGLLREETEELIRAMHEDIREFEGAVRKDEREKTILQYSR